MGKRQLTQKEIAKRLKEIEGKTKAAKENLYKLEASIAAMPADFQESRIRNRNVIPPPDDFDIPGKSKRAKKLRQDEARLRKSRSEQAIWALCCVVVLIGLALWFYTQLKSHQLLE
jgi:hypothetical protein